MCSTRCKVAVGCPPRCTFVVTSVLDQESSISFIALTGGRGLCSHRWRSHNWSCSRTLCQSMPYRSADSLWCPCSSADLWWRGAIALFTCVLLAGHPLKCISLIKACCVLPAVQFLSMENREAIPANIGKLAHGHKDATLWVNPRFSHSFWLEHLTSFKQVVVILLDAFACPGDWVVASAESCFKAGWNSLGVSGELVCTHVY